MGGSMHHTRKTHNAHNETQRRLKKVLLNSHTSTWYAAPHYSYVTYSYGRNWYIPYWKNSHCSNCICHSGLGGFSRFDNIEEAEFARKHKFLVKKSKSSGRHSYYTFAKKLMHKLWRRKGFDEKTYTIRGSYCSWSDITW